VSHRPPAIRISAVISDVDGTLLNEDKVVTDSARAVVAELRARRIAFTIISSRPPRGMRALLEPLGITEPIAGFNGGILATPELSVIEQHVPPRGTARRAVDILSDRGVGVWVFSGNNWLVRDRDGLNVDREELTVGFSPTVVDSFGDAIGAANKIVGVSEDFDLLTQCEDTLRAELSDHASIVRSQRYYLDITAKLANKGAAVRALAKLLNTPIEEVAVIGDGSNDVAMFEHSGLSIAMGNASPEVRRSAQFVTCSNAEEGFAKAMKRFVLGARSRSKEAAS
jgi:Cof subfamily protein (haloacid dehalogenase superfamily)